MISLIASTKASQQINKFRSSFFNRCELGSQYVPANLQEILQQRSNRDPEADDLATSGAIRIQAQTPPVPSTAKLDSSNIEEIIC